MKNGVRTIAKSWKYLLFHADLCEKMADIYAARAEGKKDEARVLWNDTHTWLSAKENDVQDAFDLCAFVREIEKHI